MGLFGRRRHGAAPVPEAPGSGVEESRFGTEARALGWEPTDESAFVDPLYRSVYESARVLYGQAPEDTVDHVHSYRTHFHDAFSTSVDGRRVLVANGVQNIVPNLLGGTGELRFFSVCVVELPSLYAVSVIQPRSLPHRRFGLTEIETGNAEFDHAYRVMAGSLGEAVVPPEMQRLILARDDWAFRAAEGWFVCTQKDKYDFVDDMSARIDEVLAIVAAIPESVLPAQVDHSADDLLARIGKLESVEDAIAFLQSLTPADRERLAHSPTPLAGFADVDTPEAAIARFESLDMQHRLEILTMFSKVEEG